MAVSKPQTALYVDLDGTLIKTDLLFESLLLLLKQNLLFLFLIPVWLLGGRANLKAQIASRVSIRTELLPFNAEFLDYLRTEKANGRQLSLISASNQRLVEEVNKSLGLFDSAIGSDGKTNLKAHAKLQHIASLQNGNEFVYAGNSSADLPIWQQAAEIIQVNCAENLTADLEQKPTLIFDRPQPWLPQLWRAMRPHQWLKNGLLFVPLVLAHQINEPALLLQAMVGFVCFSLCASSVYLLNDLFDLESDRQHASKQARPLASGNLPLPVGVAMAPALLASALALALLLPTDFLLILISYWLLTFLYSLYLKRLFLFDVVTLAVLYTVRLVAGAAAVAVLASPWLLTFSAAIFLSLGLVKRVTELKAARSENDQLPGRAYRPSQSMLLSGMGIGSGLGAVLVFALYIYAPETSVLYSSPMMLWPNCVLLLFLLGRLWKYALAGELQEDPVLFAISDHPSQIVTALMFAVLWLAI